MSGHSKWSSIKHKKGAADKKRGVLFSKLSRADSGASRLRGGPRSWPAKDQSRTKKSLTAPPTVTVAVRVPLSSSMTPMFASWPEYVAVHEKV